MRRAKGVSRVDDVIPVGVVGRRRGFVIKGRGEVIIIGVFIKLKRALSSSTQAPGWRQRERRNQIATYVDIEGYHNGAYHNGRDGKQVERHFKEIKKLQQE